MVLGMPATHSSCGDVWAAVQRDPSRCQAPWPHLHVPGSCSAKATLGARRETLCGLETIYLFEKGACSSSPVPSSKPFLPSPSNMSSALADAVCQRCQARFAPTERIVNSNGELYHEHCFVCAQCFRPFPEGLFYEVRVLGAQAPASSTSALREPVGLPGEGRRGSPDPELSSAPAHTEACSPPCGPIPPCEMGPVPPGGPGAEGEPPFVRPPLVDSGGP